MRSSTGAERSFKAGSSRAGAPPSGNGSGLTTRGGSGCWDASRRASARPSRRPLPCSTRSIAFGNNRSCSWWCSATSCRGWASSAAATDPRSCPASWPYRWRSRRPGGGAADGGRLRVHPGDRRSAPRAGLGAPGGAGEGRLRRVPRPGRRARGAADRPPHHGAGAGADPGARRRSAGGDAPRRGCLTCPSPPCSWPWLP